MICERCGKEFFEDYRKGFQRYAPRFCSRSCANGRSFSEESKRKKSESCKKAANAKGLIAKYKYCKVCNKPISNVSVTGFCRIHFRESPEARKKLSESLSKALKGKVGGRKNGSGTGKKGYYKGIYFDSTWELAYIVYNLEHGISFKKSERSFEYFWQNKKHKYYPDFEEGDTIVEIKGWMSDRAKTKIKAIPDFLKVKVITQKEIKPYLDYVINLYGKNFYDVLIDKKEKINPCECCYCKKLFPTSKQRQGHQGRCKNNPNYHFWSKHKD